MIIVIVIVHGWIFFFHSDMWTWEFLFHDCRHAHTRSRTLVMETRLRGVTSLLICCGRGNLSDRRLVFGPPSFSPSLDHWAWSKSPVSRERDKDVQVSRPQTVHHRFVGVWPARTIFSQRDEHKMFQNCLHVWFVEVSGGTYGMCGRFDYHKARACLCLSLHSCSISFQIRLRFRSFRSLCVSRLMLFSDHCHHHRISMLLLHPFHVFVSQQTTLKLCVTCFRDSGTFQRAVNIHGIVADCVLFLHTAPSEPCTSPHSQRTPGLRSSNPRAWGIFQM